MLSSKGTNTTAPFSIRDRSFFTIGPSHVILTSVEFDHADIYRDLDASKECFPRLIDIIPADGSLFVCSDYPAALRLRRRRIAGR